MKDKSKFRMIADQFRYLIRSGELEHGGKFPTRKELCSQFNISPMTAFHVQEELQNDGLISNVSGVGFFVNYPRQCNTSLRKIRMIGSPQAIGNEAEFGSAIVDGAREMCRECGLEFCLEFVQVLNNPARAINMSRSLAPDEGLLVLLHSELLPEIITVLMAPKSRAVTVLRSFPGKSTVLPDWNDVAFQITECLQKRGFKKILYAGLCSRWELPQHETEFFESFKKYAGSFEWQSDFSGNFREICRHVEEYRPDAVVFSHSDAAVNFMENHLPELDMPSLFLTGYGHSVISGKERELSAVYYLDARGMGRKAVSILMNHDTTGRPPLWERAEGKLVEYK